MHKLVLQDTLRQLEMVCTVTSAVSQRVRRRGKSSQPTVTSRDEQSRAEAEERGKPLGGLFGGPCPQSTSPGVSGYKHMSSGIPALVGFKLLHERWGGVVLLRDWHGLAMESI